MIRYAENVVIILMGAAGAGKTTIGRALATELGWTFVDGDDHPSVATLHTVVARALDRREGTVIGCSALRRQDRAILRGDRHPVRFVSLQAAGLDAPSPDEAITIDPSWPPARILGAIRAEFGV